MNEYENKFPQTLSDEQKAALAWKIEQDYERAETAAAKFKDEYLTFAINFYTRNRYSLEDVVAQHKAHCTALQRRRIADAFMADMKTRLRERELAYN